MRGKAESNCRQPARLRITPAYAGKSSKQSGDLSKLWDHPRLCGEKFSNCDEKTTCVGSPPPMRGKGSSVILDCVISGITPAYAGKSITEIFQKDVNKDHPRLCGEKASGLSQVQNC